MLSVKLSGKSIQDNHPLNRAFYPHYTQAHIHSSIQ